MNDLLLYFIILLLLFLIFFGNLKSLWVKVIHYFEKGKQQQKLYRALIDFPRVEGKVPQYKFYGELLELLQLAHQKWGANVRESIQDIRLALQKDHHLEKKVQEVFLGSLLQFILIGLLSWVILISFSQMRPERGLSGVHGQVLFLQVLGFCIFFGSSFYLKKKALSPFQTWLFSCYLLLGLKKVGHSLNSTMEKAKVSAIECGSNRELRLLKERLKLLLQRHQTQGKDLIVPLKELVTDIWFLYERELTQFGKKVEGIKLFVMAFFFLGSYFLVISTFL